MFSVLEELSTTGLDLFFCCFKGGRLLISNENFIPLFGSVTVKKYGKIIT